MLLPGDLRAPSPKSLGLFLDLSTFQGQKTFLNVLSHQYIDTYLHYYTLHYSTLQYITLQYSTLHCSTVHYIAAQYITFHTQGLVHKIACHQLGISPKSSEHTYLYTLRYVTLHYITVQYSAAHYITLQITC